MIVIQAPACPRCGDAGSVRLVDEREDSGIFKPLPVRPAKTLIFQCTCGWATTVRLKPEDDEPPTD